MSIKYKIIIVASVWLTVILILTNAVAYFSFLHIATSNERDLLQTRAEDLLQKFGAEKLLMNPANEELSRYLPDHGMLRILDRSGTPVVFIKEDRHSPTIEPEFVSKAESKLLSQNGEQILTYRLPLYEGETVIGTLEFAEKMEAVDANGSILVSILLISSLGAIGLSVVGGVLLSKLILKPITGIVRTMEEIENSLVFRKIPLDPGSKDELYALGSTFNRMMERIEQSFVKQRKFVSDASHELKTPITIIEGYADMLRRWGLKDEKTASEAVEFIYSESLHMKALVQQLLDMASIEKNAEIHCESIELVSFCKEVSESIRKLRGREISIRASRKKMYISVDPLQMKRLLLILLDNAMKYSTKKVEIAIEDQIMGDGGVEIRIKDYGIGIPAEERNKVFERFYRVDQARHRKTGGTGLGLSIAQNIVNQHSGTIRIESEENKGTEVIVYLPGMK